MRYLPLLLCLACQPVDGSSGLQGPPGEQGPVGPAGAPGKDATAGGDTSRDGARIQVRRLVSVITTEDGARIEGARVAVPYDAEFDVICSNLAAEDGVYRCLPKAVDLSGEPVYADAGCTQRAVVATPADKFAREYVGPSRNKTHLLGASVATVYEMDPSCVVAKGQPPAGYVARRIERAVDAGEFARTTVTVELAR